MAPTGLGGAQPGARARIGELDVLRGVGVLGILLLNIQSFAMPSAAYLNPSAFGDRTGANGLVWHATHLFGDQKFISIFSMLFGAGIVLMTSRAEAARGASAALHARRMGWLIVFGLAHAYLLWYGDILFTYGVCGLAVYLVRRWSAVRLLVVAMVVLAIPTVVVGLLRWSLAAGQWPPEIVRFVADTWAPAPSVLAAEIEAYRGGWLAQLAPRATEALLLQTIVLFLGGLGARTVGLMVLGMALLRWRVLTGERSSRFYLALATLGLGMGVPIIEVGVGLHEAHAWAFEHSLLLGPQLNYWGSVLVALGYVGVVMLACRWLGADHALLHPVACTGRMAFTNYIAQTVICTTIFYGHGLGRFGAVERTGQLAVVVAVWIAMLVWSPLWLRAFPMGPLERLWRTLTYGRGGRG